MLIGAVLIVLHPLATYKSNYRIYLKLSMCLTLISAYTGHHLRKSMLPLPLSLPVSSVGRTEQLELRLLLALCSLGSNGLRPLVFANKFRMSVNDTTPVKRPDSPAPGSAEAGTEVNGPCAGGDWGVDVVMAPGGGTTTAADPGAGLPALPGEATGGDNVERGGKLEACSKGVAGALGDGEADSTTHIR